MQTIQSTNSTRLHKHAFSHSFSFCPLLARSQYVYALRIVRNSSAEKTNNNFTAVGYYSIWLNPERLYSNISFEWAEKGKSKRDKCILIALMLTNSGSYTVWPVYVCVCVCVLHALPNPVPSQAAVLVAIMLPHKHEKNRLKVENKAPTASHIIIVVQVWRVG